MTFEGACNCPWRSHFLMHLDLSLELESAAIYRLECTRPTKYNVAFLRIAALVLLECFTLRKKHLDKFSTVFSKIVWQLQSGLQMMSKCSSTERQCGHRPQPAALIYQIEIQWSFLFLLSLIWSLYVFLCDSKRKCLQLLTIHVMIITFFFFFQSKHPWKHIPCGNLKFPIWARFWLISAEQRDNCISFETQMRSSIFHFKLVVIIVGRLREKSPTILSSASVQWLFFWAGTG